MARVDGLSFRDWAGLALVIDEASLLVTLKDDYWTGQGGVSVAVALSLIGLVGTVLVFTRSGRKPDATKSEAE